MNLRGSFKKETGLNSLESVLCDCGQTVDVWNDKYIIWLESELKKLRVGDVSVSDCISKNEVLHYMDIDAIGACSKCGSMKQYEH